MFLILWLERWSYCRRYYRHDYLLGHHHFHRILLLLCLLSVLPLSYTRYCGRHRPTATTNGLNPHDDDATSTCSSAVELHPAFSRWIQPASSNRLQPVSSSWLPPASSRFQSGSSASLKLSTTNKLICSSAWDKRKRRRCQQQ